MSYSNATMTETQHHGDWKGSYLKWELHPQSVDFVDDAHM